MSKPSANVVDLSAVPSLSVSSRTITLSAGASPGLICGYIDDDATHSRPRASQFIWIGLAIIGSEAQRLISKPSASLNDDVSSARAVDTMAAIRIAVKRMFIVVLARATRPWWVRNQHGRIARATSTSL